MDPLSTLIPVLIIAGFILLANKLAAGEDRDTRRYFDMALLFTNLLLFFLGLLLTLSPVANFAGAPLGGGAALINPIAAGAAVLGMAIWGIAASLRQIRISLARYIPINPESPVHVLALVLSGYLAGSTAFTLTQGGLEGVAAAAGPASVGVIFIQFLLFLLVALFGVGLFTRRNLRAVQLRLGLTRPTGRQLLVGTRWIVALVIVQWIFGAISAMLDPGQDKLLEEISGSLLGEIDTVWEWLLLALTTGIGEEMLFRGALQPVLGLSFTSALFAIAHIQYGITPITIAVLIIGYALGVIRRNSNTTVAIYVHAGYNFLLGMLAMLAAFLQPPPG